MPMKTELPLTPAGHVPMAGSPAAKTRGMNPPDIARPPAAPRPRRMKSRRLSLWFELPMLSSCRCGRYIVTRLYRFTMLPQTFGPAFPEDGGDAAEEGGAAFRPRYGRLRAAGGIPPRVAPLPAF